MTVAHPPWPKKKWLRLPLWAWIVAGLLLVGTVAVAAGHGGKQEHASGNKPASTEVSPAFTLPTATAPPSVASSTAPASSSATDQEAFLEWVAREDLSSLSNELLLSLDPIIAATEGYDWGGIGLACATAHDVNERLAGTLPSPSAEMNTALTNMTDDFDTALHLCQDASTTDDPALLGRASDYMNRAAGHAQEVTAILDSI